MCFQSGKPDHPSEKTSPSIVDTVFCPAPIQKQRPNIQKKKWKKEKNL